MVEIPERHPRVPGTASWSPDASVWEDCNLDESGRRHGEYSSFRADGSLRQRCWYEAGVRSGPFHIFHPNGELAREGHFVDGVPDGRVSAYLSNGESTEGLRACCVPPTAHRLQAEYVRGRVISERFFDTLDRELLSNGDPVPLRPSSLATTAGYDEVLERWVTTEVEGPLCIMRLYDLNGALVSEEAFEDSRRVRIRKFGSEALLLREEHFDRSGLLHGSRFVRYVEDEESPYLISDVLSERSQFEHGQVIGSMELVRTSGERLCFDRGSPFAEDDATHAVFTDAQRDGNAWLALAADLAEAHRIRHSFIAVARGAARLRSVEPLRAFFEQHVPPLQPARAADLAQELTRPESCTFAAVLSALLLGAAPAPALCALAKLMSNRSKVTLDVVDAALLLSPDDSDARAARVMVWLELGEPDKALADAEVVAQSSDALGAFIRAYTRALFPTWRFLPAEEQMIPSFEGLSETPAQPLESIQRAVVVYATRLSRLRRMAIALSQSSAPAWLPPELPQLLPKGPVELSTYSATIIDRGEGDESDESSEVQIDESLELLHESLLGVQARARCDWAALTWLCWVAGLDRIAWPETLAPPSDFAAAASSAIARAARAGDTVATGGFRAQAMGVPGFHWEGIAIDELPTPLARLAFNEYAELRALFLWLCFAENHSPFQSDLRAI